MKIAYCVPGTGGAFYCENCIRDCALISGLRALGHHVTVIPLYLPVNHEEGLGDVTTPIAFGAVRLYLEHRFALMRSLPGWMLNALDTPAMLRLAGSLAGSTRAAGHESLTLAMLDGESGVCSREFDRFAGRIAGTLKPDALFVSNAFLLGITSAVKAVCGITTVCIAQDEHTWVDSCDRVWQGRIWGKVAEKSRSADLLLSVSAWYAGKLGGILGLDKNRIKVIPFGVDPSRYAVAPENVRPQRIGYLGRLDRHGGVGTLIDASLLLGDRMKEEQPGVSLCGGYTADDRKFLNRKVADVRAQGGDITVYPGFDIATRRKFLSTLSLLCVPVGQEIALGAFIIEALAAGVPVVQPDQGGFGELVRQTGAGVLYTPDSPGALADALERTLKDAKSRRFMAQKGREAVNGEFNNLNMARKVVGLIG